MRVISASALTPFLSSPSAARAWKVPLPCASNPAKPVCRGRPGLRVTSLRHSGNLFWENACFAPCQPDECDKSRSRSSAPSILMRPSINRKRPPTAIVEYRVIVDPFMAVAELVRAERYLRSSFEHDVEFVEGRLIRRPMPTWEQLRGGLGMGHRPCFTDGTDSFARGCCQRGRPHFYDRPFPHRSLCG